MHIEHKLVVVFLFLLTFLTPIFTVNNVLATVGGPTFIYDFRYNPLDESVYYIKQDFGGRGCPPELIRLSLNSGKTDIAYSCSEGEKIISLDNYTSPANLEINKIIKDFKSLAPLSLKDNSISIDINFVSEENYSPEVNEVVRRHFTASIYQNGTKVNELPITGCNLNQPFTFQGYSIPGFEKKIILLLSTRGDCFEGGYINENLYVVGNVGGLNKTSSTNFYKDLSALTPNEGNLVIFESDKLSDEIVTTPNQPKEEKTSFLILITVALITLIIGTILGILLRKTPKNL